MPNPSECCFTQRKVAPLLTALAVLAIVVVAQTASGQAANDPCDHCKQILVGGTMRQYDYNNEHEYIEDIKRIISMKYDELIEESKKKTGSGRLALKIKTIIDASAGGGGSYEDNKIMKLRKEFQEDSRRFVSQHDLETVAYSIGDWFIIDAWKFCISLCSGNGQNAKKSSWIVAQLEKNEDIGGDEEAEILLLKIVWSHHDIPNAPVDVPISAFWLEGAVPIDPVRIAVGVKLTSGTVVVQPLRRIANNREVFVGIEGGVWGTATVRLRVA